MKLVSNATQSDAGVVTGLGKLGYEAPQLRNYGSLAEITLNTMSGMTTDSGGMGKSGS